MNSIPSITFKKDSIYFGGCGASLEDMIGKSSDDTNHYAYNELDQCIRDKWNEDKQKFFVCGDTMEEKREPLKWKIEYSSDPDAQGEMIALSW